MDRLILVPQYPAKLRYQEWWYTELPEHLTEWYDVVILTGEMESPIQADKGFFSPLQAAVNHELHQIEQFLTLELKSNDTLLLCDVSYPGLFTNILMHKHPKKCYAICHGTSRNRYDYFEPVRSWKWPIETAQSRVFNNVFIASHYHRVKLGWKNTIVQKFPDPPFAPMPSDRKFHAIVSASRATIQKRTVAWETKLSTDLNIQITNLKPVSWESYYGSLGHSMVLLITSKEETYGYLVVDALLNGCHVVAPRDFSYPEMLPERFLYDGYAEMRSIVEELLYDPEPVPQWEPSDFYKNIVNIMKNG